MGFSPSTRSGQSGIINILGYARKITGENRIHAVLGGLHLSGRAFGWAATDALAAHLSGVLHPEQRRHAEFAATDA